MKITATSRAWTPKSDHRSSAGSGPKKYNVPGWIAVGELQPDHVEIEGLRFFGVCDWKMRFVKMHNFDTNTASRHRFELGPGDGPVRLLAHA
jgi:hypothetical protein